MHPQKIEISRALSDEERDPESRPISFVGFSSSELENPKTGNPANRVPENRKTPEPEKQAAEQFL